MFFNLIATPGLGEKKDILQQEKSLHGQAKISINANPLNGNLFINDFTKSFTDQGFQFDVGYRYNSQSKAPWQLNQGKVIGAIQGQPNTEGSVVVVTESDGHESTYQYDATRNGYVNHSETGGGSVLTYTSEGQWTGRNLSQNTREIYNKNNQLEKIIDDAGNQLRYDYDSAGRLIAIHGNSGPKVIIDYNGQTTRIYSCEGDKKTLAISYLFDEKNQLKQTLIPTNEKETYEINYGYSDTSGLLERITQSDETTVEFGYDKHRLTKIVNGVGNTFHLSYQDNATEVLEPSGTTKRFERNESGLLKTYRCHDIHQQFHYDEQKRIKSIEYNDNSAQQFSYDSAGFCSELTSRTGEKTLHRRDKQTGLLLCETQVDGQRHLNTFYTYNDKNQLVYKVFPNGAVHAYGYDSHGHCNRETIYLHAFFDLSPLTKESNIAQDTMKQWCAQQNQADVSLTEWTHNARGQKTTQTIYATIDKDGKGVHDAQTAFEEFEWSAHGELLTHKKTLNNEDKAERTVEYDGLSRPTLETNALGQKTTHSYQKNTQQTTFVPTGLVTTVSRDAGGSIIQKEEKCEKDVTLSSSVFDSAGRPCMIKKDGTVQEYIVYDEYNRVLFRMDSLYHATRYSYDSNNNILHKTRYLTPLTSVDESALKQGTFLPEPTGDCCIETTFHDADGKLLCAINGDNGVTTHRYDAMGNRIETIAYATPLDPELRNTLSAMPKTFNESTEDRHHRYFYDDANQLIGEQTPLGKIIAYVRNANGDVEKQKETLSSFPRMMEWNAAFVDSVAHTTETFQLDARGQCIQHVNAEAIATTYTWDAGGRKIETRCDGETHVSGWDRLDRLTKESHSSGLERTILYAPCGKVSSDTQVDKMADSASRSQHMRYNGFGQITYQLTPRAALKLNDPAFANRPDLVESLWQNESIRHTYSASGLKLSTQDELGNKSYFYYNNAQELCFSISPTGSITEYTYDGIFHQRNLTRYYVNVLEETSLALLQGGVLTPELQTLFLRQRTEQDAIERVRFNNRGLVELSVDAEQFSQEKHYDAFNNLSTLIQQIDEHKTLVSKMEYDKANRPISKIQDVGGLSATETWRYVDEDNLVVFTDANQHVHRTYHDNIGRKLKEINGLGIEKSFAWDSLSRLKSTTDGLGHVTTLTYENHGRKIITTGASSSITEKNAFGEIEVEQNADGERWKKVYDVDGQLKTKIDPEGHEYHYRYNRAGWLTEVIDPLLKSTEYTHYRDGQIEQQIEVGSHENRILVFKRDAQGRERYRTDARGVSTETVYDKRGLETGKIIDPAGLALKKECQFDGLGHPVKEIKGSKKYPDQLTVQFVTDKLGRVIQKIVDPKGLRLVTSMTYDAVGNCIAITDPNQHTTRFYYDAAHQERYSIDPMGGVIGKSYNANGQCIEERHYAIALGINVLQEITLESIEKHLTPSAEDKVHYYAYDAENRCIGSLDANSKLTRYTYNAQGKKTHEISYATPVSKSDFMVVNHAVTDNKLSSPRPSACPRGPAGSQCDARSLDSSDEPRNVGILAKLMALTPAANAKDRQSAWFYDARGNERFAINGEGILSEQRWNAKGWLIEERIYTNPYKDYAQCPSDAMLAQQEYRAIRYVHDTFGRVVFEIDGEGYVTEYGYTHGDKPTTNWFYPEKIAVPKTLTLSAIRELLPPHAGIPCTQVEYDAAFRKVSATDQLNYREEFQLDALDNLREYIDKGGDSWTFEVDAAGRKIAESTPPVEVTSVTSEGKLIKPTGKQRITKKTEYVGDMLRITEAHGTMDARCLELHQNPCGETITIEQQGVHVYDKTRLSHAMINDYEASPSTPHQTGTTPARPENTKTLTIKTVYNAFKKPVVITDESGQLRFKVYEADKLRYEIDQEGFVTAYEYNVFGNIIKLTRHAEKVGLDLMSYATQGIPLSVAVAAVKPSKQDRHVVSEFDNANRPIKTTQDEVLVYSPQTNGEPQYGLTAPEHRHQYNAFGEIESSKELVNPFKQEWDNTRTWFNKSGHVIAQLDGLNYLTVFEPDRYGNNLKVTEYAKPLTLPLDEKLSVNTVMNAIIFDDENDRVYTNEFNARGEVVKLLQHNVRLHDPELDVSSVAYPPLSQGKQTLKHEYEYTPKGKLRKEVFPNGSFTLTEHDARNLPVLKTEPSRTLESGAATPVITTGYNAFAQPTRITHHKHPYEKQAYLKESDEDQTQLTGFDNRGLQIVTVDPEGAVHYQSFTDTKKLAASWIWVSGWGDNASLIKRLHLTDYGYDKRGIETRRCESIEGGDKVVTTTRSNAFGEKVAEGYGDDRYPVYWLHDKTGAVWNTNEQHGVPVIKLRDARGQETVNLRSRTRSLKDVTTIDALKKILTLDYRDLQRLELQRNIKGSIEAQLMPAFKTLKLDAPEPYYTAVSSGRSHQAFGKVSLSWPTPEIAGLESDIVIWPKGREQERQSLTIIQSGTRCGVDVSKLPTNDYQYQIDFYYRDPKNGQRDSSPRYRAEGSAFVITDVIDPNHLIWYQTDEQHVMLFGKLGDVSGIELMQGGVSAGRVAMSSTETPNCWSIDLSDKPSGRYEFRLLRGYSLLEEQPIKIGVPSPKGTRMDAVTTHFTQATHLTAENLAVPNYIVTSTWENLPPQLSNAYQELTVINASTSSPTVTFKVDYATPQPYLITIDSKKPGSSQLNNYNTMINAFAPFPLLCSSTITRNQLFTIDENNQKHTIVECVNNETQSSFVYVQPGSGVSQAAALREHFPDGRIGKTIALNQWMNQSSRCPTSMVNQTIGYELISLQTTVPEPISCGEITIHTANMRSKQLLVREIALTKPMVSKVNVNFSNNQIMYPYSSRNALSFKWELPGFLANSPVKVNYQLHFNHPSHRYYYGDTYTFEYTVGKAFHIPYNGCLLPLPIGSKPAFSDFDINSLNMYVQYNGDWIPLLNSNTFTMDRTVQTKPFALSMQMTYFTGYSWPVPCTVTETINSYNEGDVATFQDTYTLLFYPLPEGINASSIQLEYNDLSLPVPQWRKLLDAQYTGHAIAAPANPINPGTYQFRLKAKDTHGADVNFSAIAEQSHDGWALGQFTVTHGGTLSSVSRTTPSQEVIRPIRRQTADRWDNVVSSTNASGKTTTTTFNGRNKPLRKTEPPINTTDECGAVQTVAPKTRIVYDLSDDVIAVSDPNNHMTYHERDNDGKTLKTTLADGVFKRFIPDIFGQTVKIMDPFNQSIILRHDRCNRNVLREDENHWKTVFRDNELGARLSITRGPGENGQTETERFDYLHPCRQVTHHYLPGGPQYKTVRRYQRHGITIQEILADNRQNGWDVDDFGLIIGHTDLSGVHYTETRNPNYPTEVIQRTSVDGKKHGTRLRADGTPHPVNDQHLGYQYDEASHLVSILDDAVGLTTLYRHDVEGRCARETFRGSDGHIHQAVLMKWNDVGWLEEAQDTVMKVNFTHDAKGNRRSTIASVFWDGQWKPSGYENWYTYTKSDSMEINRGRLDGGKIKITPEQGTKLLYDVGGRRHHEVTLSAAGTEVNKTLWYQDNNLLRRSESTNGDYADYQYDGQIARRKVLSTNKSEQKKEYTSNGCVVKETFRDDIQNITYSTDFKLNGIGVPEEQTTNARSKDQTDGFTDKVNTHYAAFDTDKVSKVIGARQRDRGESTQSSVVVLYDPNGYAERVEGTGQDPRHFITNSQGRIVKKSVGQDKDEFYFYTTSGSPIGRFGNIPPEGFRRELSHIDFDLNYHAVNEHFPSPGPSSDMVLPGDTFYSISERMHDGDPSFAERIANAYGYHKDDTPPPGLVLQLPSIVNTNIHNWDGLYPAYNPTAIIGSLYPNMPMPARTPVQMPAPRHHHRKFWHVLVEAIAGAVVMAFAPELAGVFSKVLVGAIGKALGYAIAGAASNLVQQELAVQLGDQSKLSLNALGQSALLSLGTAGIAKTIGLGVTNMSVHQRLIKNIELTIATQALSFATGQQRHFDWRVMLASITNAVANVGAKEIHMGGPLFNEAVATASASVASIGVDKLYGTHMDSEDIVANTLGTFIGNQIAAEAKKHYADYQAKKALDAAIHRSSIPEISEELVASKQAFIQSVLAHPHAHGTPPAEVKPQRRAHHGPAMKTQHVSHQSHHKTKTPPAHKTPPQEHLMMEREREEAVMSRASRWNNAHSQTQAKAPQPRASQHGFWGMVERAANSRIVTTINEVGDNVAHTVMDMFDPVKQFKHTMADADASVKAYRSGHVFRGMALTGKTALDASYFVPLERAMVETVQFGAHVVTAVGSRLGLFGSTRTTEQVYMYNLVENPGPLSEMIGTPAANFAGGKYNVSKLENDTILFRAGEGGGNRKAFGQWFTREAPKSVAEVRIDSAVKPYWLNNGVLLGKSPIDSVYAIKIPKRTIIYEGPVGYQGGIYLGGQNKLQIFIPRPWEIKDIEILYETSITGPRL